MIVARIQGHPSRNALHDRLIGRLGMETQLFLHESDPPDPWAGYRACLSDIPDIFSHVVIAQDDCLPAPGFAFAVEWIAERHPNDPVCLFLGAFPASTAARVRRSKPDVRYVPLGPSSFMPLLCVLWPVGLARSFLAWSQTARGMTRADDGNAARWLKATRQQVWVTVPSLVEHDDYTPSVKGGRDHVPGAEAWRRTVLLADDATNYEW